MMEDQAPLSFFVNKKCQFQQNYYLETTNEKCTHIVYLRMRLTPCNRIHQYTKFIKIIYKPNGNYQFDK